MAYVRQIGAGTLATVKSHRLTEEERLRAAIIDRLMCDFGVDVSSLCRRHGFDPGLLLDGHVGLAMLKDDGVINIDDGVIRVR